MARGERGSRRRFRWAAGTFSSLLVLSVSFVSVTGSTETPRVDPPSRRSARLVDIGGDRELYLDCRGTGSPTVVLVSGTGGAHDEWTHVVKAGSSAAPQLSRTAVLPRVARSTRVCAYDRPGTTRLNDAPSPSTSVAQPTTAQADVADLGALLARAEEPGPYVLVGASWGGMIVNLFARNHPTDVAGLVFVDGASDYFADALTPDQWNAWMHVIATSTPPGREAPDYESSVDELRAAPAIPARPAAVLTADKPWNLPLEGTGATWPAWTTAQRRLARALHASHITKTGSGHAIAVENPRVVADAIRDVVRRVRHDPDPPASSTPAAS
jgi:pimeloyl-ACP methyl ester carboxylesterase